MKKAIYLMRHSEPLKFNNIENNDSLQIQNEKWPLTENGERIAKKVSEITNKFDYVTSSNYVRAISTAKYFTNEKVNIDENFGERKFGINSWEELPKDFGLNQFNDHDYKLGDGESINEVIDREYNSLLKLLNSDYNKILIVGHSTAFAALLSKWCEISYDSDYYFNGKSFFDGKWNYCETFKLEFEDNNLINIENIRY